MQRSTAPADKLTVAQDDASMATCSAPRLLIVDDDRELTSLLAEFLQREGFHAEIVADADSASTQLLAHAVDLVILDVMLPGRHGFDWLREARERWPKLPVVMLTARGEPIDRVLGLELGADDYLAKPFDPRELAARIRAVLRRSSANESAPTLRLGALDIDVKRRRATLAERPLELTGAEFRVLCCLAQTPATPVERSELTERALGRALTPYDRSIDTHVSNVRRKLEKAGSHGILIRAVRGTGYELIDLGITERA